MPETDGADGRLEGRNKCPGRRRNFAPYPQSCSRQSFRCCIVTPPCPRREDRDNRYNPENGNLGKRNDGNPRRMGRMDGRGGRTGSRATGGALLLSPQGCSRRSFRDWCIVTPRTPNAGTTGRTDSSQQTEIWTRERTEACNGWDGRTSGGVERPPGPLEEVSPFSPKLSPPNFSLLYLDSLNSERRANKAT